MPGGCVAEVDMFMAYREELAAEQVAPILRHIAGCSLCHDLWKRFEVDERVARGIHCAIDGDADGADRSVRWAPDSELPENLEIPGFDIRPGYIEGGQARVYRGTYEASQEEVAVKVFHDSLLNEGGNERFAREIKSLARLRHPNVITIRSDGQIDGHAYFVMPWIEGLTLDEHIAQAHLSFDNKVDLISKICDAVNHAHLRGVMHLDLKPSNVRVDASGEPIVMDFGLARLTETDYSESPDVPAGVAGTPMYMAPEQIENREDLDVRADVYGLGLLLYEALVERRAKGAALTGSQQASWEVVREVPPAPRTVDPRVPRELEAITHRAIELERDRRYSTARKLYDDLQSFRHGLLVAASADRRLYRLRKWTHRYREALAALGLIVLIVGFAVAIRMRLNNVTEQQTRVVEQMWQEANEAAIQREQDYTFELTRVRRSLVRALEDVESLARALGRHDLVQEAGERIASIQAELGETEMSPVDPE